MKTFRFFLLFICSFIRIFVNWTQLNGASQDNPQKGFISVHPSPWSAKDKTVTGKPKGTIYIIPVGKVEDVLLKDLALTLEQRFMADCKIGESIETPPDAYNPERKQYHSTIIINSLKNNDLSESLKILGVTELDLFVPELTFVFGQADLDGPAAIISLHRLRQEFYGKGGDEALFRQRMLKEGVHELGHTWGLRHCKNSGCVMHFSNSIADTDQKLADFCKRCKKAFDQNRMK